MPGIVQPTDDMFVLHYQIYGPVTLMRAKSDYVPQVCYRKLNPQRITLENSNEIRQASPGEWGFDPQEKSIKHFPVGSFEKYQIWREIKGDE